MQDFKNLLQSEYLKRVSKNKSYSLRAYAQHLGINHATLSTLLSGKRKVTKATVLTLSRALGLSPDEVTRFLVNESQEHTLEEKAFHLLQNDVFSFISEWYYDAILELSLIPHIQIEPKAIALILNITTLQATMALDILERLELFKKDENGKFVITYKNSTNILDPETTTSAQKNYQKSVLEKSIEALESVDRKKRDHTSTTMAISSKDLPKAKEIIKKFRHDLNAFMQKDESSLDEVYQLQVSFFPLTNKEVSYEN
jgi:uncharacterized protein (TIGR02147 family)